MWELPEVEGTKPGGQERPSSGRPRNNGGKPLESPNSQFKMHRQYGTFLENIRVANRGVFVPFSVVSFTKKKSSASGAHKFGELVVFNSGEDESIET